LICLSHSNNNIISAKTYAYSSEQCHGGKYSKERLTVLVVSNMDGSVKNRLLVIGKSKNPRTMKTILKESLPVTYEHNKKAWMISDILRVRWLLELRQKFLQEGRKVLIFLHNCSGNELTLTLK
jgi:hypothetical protein